MMSCRPATHSLMFIRAVCSRRVPYVFYMSPSVLVGLSTVDVLVGGAGS